MSFNNFNPLNKSFLVIYLKIIIYLSKIISLILAIFTKNVVDRTNLESHIWNPFQWDIKSIWKCMNKNFPLIIIVVVFVYQAYSNWKYESINLKNNNKKFQIDLHSKYNNICCTFVGNLKYFRQIPSNKIK